MKKLLKIIGKIKRLVVSFIQNISDKKPIIPENLEKIVIGKSIKGIDIDCYKIGTGSTKVLYTSGIHGNEVGTVKLAYNLINFLTKNTDKLIDYTIYVIPCLNLDGYNLAINNPDYINSGKIGRFNANNVDLNRNFDTKSFTNKSIRSFGKDYSESVEVFCGNKGNSEPEVSAFTNFILNNNIGILFMFHNAGNDVLGNKTELSQKIANTYSEKTGFKLLSEEYWKTLNQTGTAKEWCDENDITYLEIEGSSRYGSDWNVQKNAIEETLFMI